MGNIFVHKGSYVTFDDQKEVFIKLGFESGEFLINGDIKEAKTILLKKREEILAR